MPTLKNCFGCKNDFYVKKSKAVTAKYCSRNCKDKPKVEYKNCKKCHSIFDVSGRKRNRVYCSPACKVELKVCVVCNVKFKPTNKNRLLCSRKCSGLYFSANYNYRVDKSCATCNAEFRVPSNRRNTSKYCSNECRLKRAKLESERAKIIIECGACSGKFEVIKSQGNTKYCSFDCRHNHARIRGNRKCTACKRVRDLDNFPENKKTKIGFGSVCKECLFQIRRETSLLKQYGITHQEFTEIAETQNYLCLICISKPNRLFVDHCHKTGKVRGLLCPLCNAGIGMFKDNPNYLKSAIDYLTLDRVSIA